ncbi:MAG: hypothetical protein J6Y28_03645 [Acholeplasmatales bacterium]|nr:hypothetical protein [Acholeplasmatales bacterium]
MKKLFVLISLSFILFGCSKKKVYEKENDTIYFGSYPQTLVTDNNIKEELNKKITNLPNKDNLCGWTDCNYYISFKVESYMYYIDIDLDNNGTNDYRGIYFNQYRPNGTIFESTESTSFQSKNGYFINNVYWFKYEKIKWDILENDKKEATLISNLVIDSQEYYHIIYKEKVEHNGGYGYTNSYELSNIRKWLNDNFYNLAFNSKEKEIIINKLIDNSAKSTDTIDNIYYSDDTNDYVTLLSYQEVLKYYESKSRNTLGTDYAKCQGLTTYEDTVSWHLRSASSDCTGSSWYVENGESIVYYNIYDSSSGVRPVITIKL